MLDWGMQQVLMLLCTIITVTVAPTNNSAPRGFDHCVACRVLFRNTAIANVIAVLERHLLVKELPRFLDS